LTAETISIRMMRVLALLRTIFTSPSSPIQTGGQSNDKTATSVSK